MKKPNYTGKGDVKKLPATTTPPPTTAKMPKPKAAGKMGQRGGKGKESSCGK